MAMAFSAPGLARRIPYTRSPLLFCIRKARLQSSVAIRFAAESGILCKEEDKDCISFALRRKEIERTDSSIPQWKTLSSEDVGIDTSMISKPTRLVLNGLRKQGYEVYLVGGCVRDLVLRRIPKDFDIITSAQLKEVRKIFTRSLIVGKRFPICHVYVLNTIIEVSSFSTSGSRNGFNNYITKPSNLNEPDYIRWKNCSQRDFTINSLMYDPYKKIVYDYLGAMEDIRKSKVRTIKPANLSFTEDCARILRAVRIAARLGFCFTRDIALSIKELSCSVLKLDKVSAIPANYGFDISLGQFSIYLLILQGRILMEMNYMLAFGSAEASLRLLWRFGLLEILLPIQASYFVSQGFRRRDASSNMLLILLSNLDKFVAPNRPCHSSLWIALLAFHKALVDQPQDPVVVAAFSLAVHSGGSLYEAIEIAQNISQPHASFHEIVESNHKESDYSLLEQVVDLAVSVDAVICKMTNKQYVSQAMIKYPQAPWSDLVFIPQALSMRVRAIFGCVRSNERGPIPKRSRTINHDSLAMGILPEVRHVFARIVFDTVFPRKQNGQFNNVEPTKR
ncbi:poly(A) polymerase I isoform X2 [Benincasa hispida]|uniref:poly(A) polymerase I isoform X2 n=1 Tax=Benincasa hispida TaxID=102211 RepID=UPI0018FFEC35|nr:poly(A) polymerase I isoform X2 [Benincasa hispida]